MSTFKKYMNFVEVKYALLFEIYMVHLLQYLFVTLMFLIGKLENNYKKRVNILDKNNGSHKILATITLLRIFYSLLIDIIDNISFRFSLMFKDTNEHLKG